MMTLLTILTVLLALAGAACVITRPFLAFIPVAIMFALEQLAQAYFPILQVHQSLFNYGVGALAMFALLVRIVRRDPITSGFNNPITILIMAQFALWMIAMLYSPESAPPSTSLRTVWPYLVLYFFVLPNLLVSLEEFRRVLTGLMIVGSVLAVLIMLNPNTSYYNGRLTLDLGMMASRADQVGNPLATATLGGMTALIAALVTPKQINPLFTMLRAVAFVSGMGLAIGSGSRGQVLATVVAGIMFYPVARRLNNPRNFILSALGLAVIAAGIYGTFHLFIGDQNRERWDAAHMLEDITMRFDMCALYIETWISSPAHWLFGLGSNAWMGIGAAQYSGDYVHNIAVEILCEQGLVGAAIFVTTTVLVIRAGMRMWAQNRNDTALRATSALLLAVCAFELFNALKQGSISNGAPFFWWLVMAKISTREQSAPEAMPIPDAHSLDWDEQSSEIDPDFVLARS